MFDVLGRTKGDFSMQEVNNREVVLQMIKEIIFITAPAIVLQVDPTGGLMQPSGMSCLFPISTTMLSVWFTSKKMDCFVWVF